MLALASHADGAVVGNASFDIGGVAAIGSVVDSCTGQTCQAHVNVGVVIATGQWEHGLKCYKCSISLNSLCSAIEGDGHVVNAVLGDGELIIACWIGLSPSMVLSHFKLDSAFIECSIFLRPCVGHTIGRCHVISSQWRCPCSAKKCCRLTSNGPSGSLNIINILRSHIFNCSGILSIYHKFCTICWKVTCFMLVASYIKDVIDWICCDRNYIPCGSTNFLSIEVIIEDSSRPREIRNRTIIGLNCSTPSVNTIIAWIGLHIDVEPSPSRGCC